MSGDDFTTRLPLRVRARIAWRDFLMRRVRHPWQMFRRRHGLADSDVFLQIKVQTNATCTRKCRFCHFGQSERPSPATMDDKVFADIIDDLAGIRFSGCLGIFEINEPLTDKRIFDLHAHARERLPHAWLYLASNGDLLDEQSLSRLVRNGLNILYLNSYDNKALTRNMDFLDRIDPRLRKRVHHMNRTYQTDWESRGGNIEGYRKAHVEAPCDLVYNLCYVKPTGTVHCCINDFYDKVVLGNMTTDRLMNIWFGPAMTRLRQELNRGNRSCNELCGQCDYRGFRSIPPVPLSWRARRFFSGHALTAEKEGYHVG